MWKDPTRAKKCLGFNSPNKQEIKLGNILDSLYPGQYKFVGDGQIVIAGKCPDFINVNGQKKLIELYGDYWHKGDDPQDREAIFSPFGYKTLVIWQSEFKNIKEVESRIKVFHEKRFETVA